MINAEILEIKKSSTLNTVKALVPAVTKWICSNTGKVEVDLVMPEAAYATSDAKTIATRKWWEAPTWCPYLPHLHSRPSRTFPTAQ